MSDPFANRVVVSVFVASPHTATKCAAIDVVGAHSHCVDVVVVSTMILGKVAYAGEFAVVAVVHRRADDVAGHCLAFRGGCLADESSMAWAVPIAQAF